MDNPLLARLRKDANEDIECGLSPHLVARARKILKLCDALDICIKQRDDCINGWPVSEMDREQWITEDNDEIEFALRGET